MAYTNRCLLLLAALLCSLVATMTVAKPAQAIVDNVEGTVVDSNPYAASTTPLGSLTVTLYDVTNPSVTPIQATVSGTTWGALVLTNTSDTWMAFASDSYYQAASTPHFTIGDPNSSDFAISLTPETFTLQGTVTDAATGFPLNGGGLFIEGDHQLIAMGTDDTGHYSWPGLPDDVSYSVGSGGGGQYATFSATVMPGPGGTVTQNIALTPAPGIAEVAGTVSDGSGHPLANVPVDVVGDSTSYSSTDYALTNTHGQYVVWVPDAGVAHEIEAAPDQPQDLVFQYYTGQPGGTQDADLGVPVQDSAGTVTQNIDFTLAAGAAVSGRVTDDTGAPVSGAGVEIYTADYDDLEDPTVDGSGHEFTATTAADGSYQIKGLPPGEYIVNADAPSGSLQSAFYPAATSAAAATPVGLASGDSRSDIDITLQRNGSLQGSMTEAGSGAGVSGWVDVLDQNGDQVTYTATGTDGSYRFTGLAPGTYYLYFYGNAASGDAGVFYGGSATEAGSQTVTIAPGASTSANQILPRGGFITGTVTDNATSTPLQGVTVTLLHPDGTPVFANGTANVSAKTAPDGSYRFGPLLPGNYVVSFDAKSPNLALQYYSGAGFFGSASQVVVSAGHTTDGIDAALTPGGAISGAVTDAGSGRPLDDATIELEDSAGHVLASTTTGPDGSYTFNGLAPGSYYLFATAPDGSADAGAYYPGALDIRDAQAVAVSASQSTGSIDIALGSAASTGTPTTTTTVTTPGQTVTIAATTTSTTTTTTPTTAKGTSKPTAPTISAGRLSGIAENKTTAYFKLAAGKNGAPALKSVRIKLPKSLSFKPAALKHDLTLAKGDKFAYNLTKGILDITLKAPKQSIAVDLKPGSVTATNTLAKQAKAKKLKAEKIAVDVYDANNHQTPLSFTIKKPS